MAVKRQMVVQIWLLGLRLYIDFDLQGSLKIYFFNLIFFYLVATLPSMWHPSSPTRDPTHTPYIGSEVFGLLKVQHWTSTPGVPVPWDQGVF